MYCSHWSWLDAFRLPAMKRRSENCSHSGHWKDESLVSGHSPKNTEIMMVRACNVAGPVIRVTPAHSHSRPEPDLEDNRLDGLLSGLS
jgi:hypothetical protein